MVGRWGLLCGVSLLFLLARYLVGRRVVDLSPLTVGKIPLNALSFAVRRWLSWSRGSPRLPIEPKDALFDYLDDSQRPAAEARELNLRERYQLHSLRDRTSRRLYRENLYVLDLLDRVARRHLAPNAEPSLLDVGSKDFGYAAGLARFLMVCHGTASISVSTPSSAALPVRLVGVELDGYGIYRDGYSRRDYAEAHLALAGHPPDCYRVQDFCTYVSDEVDVITLFFPFVTRFALLSWGLPRRYFDPRALFAHAAMLLKPGGLMVVVNHTFEERDRARELLAELSNLMVIDHQTAGSLLVDYVDVIPERTMTVLRRIQTSGSQP